MPLPAGARFGPYEIVSPIGRGGMGEVYKARDTRLDRTVAIKILHMDEAANPQFRARFEREARSISQLAHPNICTLHDIGRQDAIDYLVLEYLEGETLAARLERTGALKLDEALRIAIEITAALECAHRAGITHRDLKPGNIVLTRGGAKLLDFGLASAAVRGIGSAAVAEMATAAASLTAEGTILGTLQYMSPEQLEGRPADARTDIFAFGAVLYEMLTAKKAFEARSQASLIAAILERDPPAISTLQPLASPGLERIVTRCLAKDPDDRWQTATDLKSELLWITRGSAESVQPAAPGVGRPTRERVAWTTAGVLLVALVASFARGRIGSVQRTADDERVYRSSITLPDEVTLARAPAGRFALSPDGRHLAFVGATRDGRRVLWIRSLDSAVAQPLAGTDDPTFPFWSPDSRFIAFQSQGKLKKIDASGGPVSTLCDAASNSDGTWNRDGLILFNPGNRAPLYRVSAAGGTPTPATTLDTAAGETQHWFPVFLPDGRHFLYFALGSKRSPIDPRAIYVGSLDGKEPPKLLVEGGSNAKYAQGHLLFLRGRTLLAQPLDTDRLELKGEPVSVAEQIQMPEVGDTGTTGAFSVADSGAIVFQAGPNLTKS